MAKKQSYTFIIDLSDTRNKYLYEILSTADHAAFAYTNHDWHVQKGDTKVFVFAPRFVVDKETVDTIPNGSIIFATKLCGKAQKSAKLKAITSYNYFDDNDLAIANAYLTAEGTLATIINAMPRIMPQLHIAILGFGRIGRSLARLLMRNSATVSIVSKEESERASAASFYRNIYDFSSVAPYLDEFDCVINTAPALVLDKIKLASLRPDCLIIDLASAPGGTDFDYAQQLGLNAIHLLGVPGKTSPESAAHLIKKSIFRTLDIKL